MPYGMKTHKRPGGHGKCYSVKNKTTGHAFSKCTTHSKAERQERLLRAVEHCWHPTHAKHAPKH